MGAADFIFITGAYILIVLIMAKIGSLESRIERLEAIIRAAHL